MSRHVDVIIVGAGPVGLLLGCCLQQAGRSFVVLEKRQAPAGQARAIGIHPPALELLARLGLAEQLIDLGVRIRQGAAYSGTRRLGAVNFARGPGPFGFVLSVPQAQTEQVLREALPAEALHYGAEAVALHSDGEGAEVTTRGPDGEARWQGQFVAGCDGRHSTVRQLLGIPFEGGSYPDRFTMGDFRDASGYGDEARIFLDSRGFIESFPLPGSLRRWVLLTGRRATRTTVEALVAEVAGRCGVDPGAPQTPLSDFGVHHHLARTFVQARVALVGDAAHVMCPMGGQGMNIGWLDAWDFAEALRTGGALAGYAVRARARAGRAIRRAGANLAIGRGGFWPALRTGAVQLALRLPIQAWLVNRFTLRGI